LYKNAVATLSTPQHVSHQHHHHLRQQQQQQHQQQAPQQQPHPQHLHHQQQLVAPAQSHNLYQFKEPPLLGPGAAFPPFGAPEYHTTTPENWKGAAIHPTGLMKEPAGVVPGRNAPVAFTPQGQAQVSIPFAMFQIPEVVRKNTIVICPQFLILTSAHVPRPNFN